MSKTKINDPGAHHAGSGALIRRFLPYLAKYKKTLFLDLFCAALTTLCDIVLPKIMSTITNSAMGVGITLTAGIVLRLAALYFVLRIIDGAASYYMSSIGHIMGVHIETDMRRDAFDHLLKLDHTYYNNTKVGTIMGRITNDLFDVTEFAHHCPEEFFIAAIKIVVSFIILCRASVPLTLAVFACVPLMGVVSVYLNGRLRARFRQQRVQIGELNSTIEDSLLGQGVVKAFAAEDEEREKFAKGNRDFEQIKTLGYYAMGAFNTSTRLFDGLMYLVVILAGGLSLVYGRITAGDMVAYMLYVTTLIATIRRIVEFAEQFQRGMTGIERFAEIMDTPVTIGDAPDAVPLQPGPGDIRFENVSFEYPDDHNKVLHNVSLDIRPGERLALVGPSGGGKTTLCNLIPRFYEVTSGRILIDGQDIRHVTLKSLRQDIGIVQQDVYLFSGTVAQNIAYGKPGATREEIMEAARLAGADPARVTFLCLFHDLHEARTGDFNYVNHRYNQCRAREALEDATQGTGLAEDILGFWDELADGRSLEAELAHDADQLDLICNLHVELSKGNAFAEEWLDSALKRLRTPLARELAEAVLRTDPNRWWYGQVDKGWWVHHRKPEKF